jgi:hypothetical protein
VRRARTIPRDTYRGPAQGHCEIHFQAAPNQNMQLVINPQAGPAPLRLGTKDFGSFLKVVWRVSDCGTGRLMRVRSQIFIQPMLFPETVW